MGRRRYPWWKKKTARKQLSAKLKEILTAARERRWKSGRRGGSRGDREKVELEYDAMSDGHRYAWTDTGDAWVG